MLRIFAAASISVIAASAADSSTAPDSDTTFKDRFYSFVKPHVSFSKAPPSSYWRYAPAAERTAIATCTFGDKEITEGAQDVTHFDGQSEGLRRGVHELKLHKFGDLQCGYDYMGSQFDPDRHETEAEKL